MSRLRCLGVLLCYNDGDILADVIEHLLNNDHDVIAWNHGSTDETASVLARLAPHMREVTDISRDVDFYDMYPLMSRHLMKHYVSQYDWISWPDQDEVLEGPSRSKRYIDYLEDVAATSHSWIEFHDFVYWFTDSDPKDVAAPTARVRHYGIARHGAIKVRSWRASTTNIRWFNHNRTDGSKYPILFNLRHYPMRSAAQMQRRIAVDRANLQHGPVNYHYENMKRVMSKLHVRADQLHHDDGVRDLDPTPIIDWSGIYGTAPSLPRPVIESYFLSTRRWEVAALLDAGLGKLRPDAANGLSERIERWRRHLSGPARRPVIVAMKSGTVKIIGEELAQAWHEGEATDATETEEAETHLGDIPVVIHADARARTIRVTARVRLGEGEPLPMVALMRSYGGPATLTTFDESGTASFCNVAVDQFYLAAEPSQASDEHRIPILAPPPSTAGVR